MSHAFLLASLVASTALVAPALAQQSNAQPAASQSTAAQPKMAPMSTADFVREAAIGNMFEIQSSQVAKSRSQNDKVQQFAQRLIQDHGQAADRLKADAQGQTLPQQLDDRHAQLIKDLQSLNGPNFDRRFVAEQITAHQNAIELYDNYSTTGDAQKLKQFAQETLPTLKEHLKLAEQLNAALPPDRIGAQTGGNGQQQAAGQSDTSHIVVQQTAPTVRVDQASPQVTVHQPEPNVTVTQARPQITIRQPQPTVTIDIPQPEITVRMPKPGVNVSMAQPQVEVNQPKPSVQIVQPQKQPNVQVDRNQQAQVQIVQPQGQPDVNVQKAEGNPVVNYEREQPRVVVNQPKGQPKITVETADSAAQSAGNTANGSQQAQAASTAAAGSGTQQQATAQKVTQNDEDLRTRINAGDTETTGSVNPSQVPTRGMAVHQIEDMSVFNAKGEKLGKVDRLLADAKGRKFLVVGSGGFFGIGRDRVAFPLDRFWVRGDRLVIRGVTENDIESMDNYKDQFDRMQRLSANDQEKIRVWQ